MPYKRRIVCLANSRKESGRCVAGLEIVESGLKGWIRPVSGREKGELSLDERRYENGQDVQLLDIIDIRFVEPRPHGCQVENHLIEDVSSSYGGSNDRIPVVDADYLDHSLKLVQPEALRIWVGKGYRKRQVRAVFQLGKVQYNLGVTDTKIEARYLAMKDGEYDYSAKAVACISLGEPFKEYRYKLVASIVDLP